MLKGLSGRPGFGLPRHDNVGTPPSNLRWKSSARLRVLSAASCASALCVLLGAGQASAATASAHFAKLPATMVKARWDAAAASLSSGQVVIAGGKSGSFEYPAEGELFNPGSDTFTKIGATTERREGAVAAGLAGGYALFAGGSFKAGEGATVEYRASAELFNEATNTFTKLAASMTEAREAAGAATLPDGDVLILGGTHEGFQPLATAEIYEAETRTFTRLEGAGRSLIEGRMDPAVATLPDGEVLIAGGYTEGPGGTSESLATAEVFDPATQTFKSLASEELEARGGARAVTLPGGEVLIVGGSGDSAYLRSAELFNPATGTFTQLAGTTVEERESAVAMALPNGQVLIAGGYPGASGFLNTAEMFLSAPRALISGGDLGEQTVDQRSAGEVLEVENLGAQALDIRGLSPLAGAGAEEFTVDADQCAGATLAFEQTCTITVHFDPSAEGSAAATMALEDNEPAPAVIALSGVGLPAVRGPQGEKGETGPAGPQGEQGEPGAAGAPGQKGETGALGPIGPQGETGATGAQGAAGQTGATGLQGDPGASGASGAQGEKGATGPRGPAGRNGRVELVTCLPSSKLRNGKHVMSCTTKTVKSPAKLKAAAHLRARATLARAGKRYAVGRFTVVHGRTSRLVLHLKPHVRARAGAYTLTLRWKSGASLHERIRIA